MDRPIVTSSDILTQNSYSTSKEHIDEVITAVISSTTNQVADVPTTAAPTTTTTTSFGTPRSTANSYSDFPENLLENSSTPPLESIQRDNIAGTFLKVDSSSFNKSSALNNNGQLRLPTTTVVSAAPVFASLAPVSIDVNFLPSADVFSILPTTNSNNVNIATVGGNDSSPLLSINSLNGKLIKRR
uniref:Uncharacterized protein n=1 Tax=Romanomermis culicivorax TaxID=13658 RepID=A0A915JAW6_ROMCU